MPAKVKDHLKLEYTATGYRNFCLIEELKCIHKAFSAGGIDYVLLKGLALASTVYKDPATRPMRDMDILVAPKDFKSAQEVIKTLDYRLVETKLRQFYPIDLVGHIPYTRFGKIPFLVEIHQNLIDPPLFDPAPFWSKTEEIHLVGEAVVVLGQEATMFNLCLHHTVGHWYGRLLTALDLALMVGSKEKSIDWSYFINLTEQTGFSWTIGQALQSVDRLFGLSIDKDRINELLQNQPGFLRRRLFNIMVKDAGQAQIDYPVKLILFAGYRFWLKLILATFNRNHIYRQRGLLFKRLGGEIWRSLRKVLGRAPTTNPH